MTKRFDTLFDIILIHEGGYVNDVDDPGGATKYGISLRYLKGKGELGDLDHDGDIDGDDIKLVDKEVAGSLYYMDFYQPVFADSYDSARAALLIFDHAVNAGVRGAKKLLQRAVGVEADGIIGPKTLRAVDNADTSELIQKIAAERIHYYSAISTTKPKLKKFLKGWVNRVHHCMEVSV